MTRYRNKRVGGTIVVHFIKKHMWFLETALALLETDDYSDFDRESLPESGRLHVGVSSVWTDNTIFAQRNRSFLL